jgi:hypothetical protein
MILNNKNKNNKNNKIPPIIIGFPTEKYKLSILTYTLNTEHIEHTQEIEQLQQTQHKKSDDLNKSLDYKFIDNYMDEKKEKSENINDEWTIL